MADRIPVYDSHTTKAEAIALVRGVIPTGSPVCLRCQYLAALAIVDERWRVGEAMRQEAENVYFEMVEHPPKRHTC